MAQPTKRANINPMDYFSKELTGLIAHITNDIAPIYGVSEITPELFVFGALETPDCILYKALNTSLNTFQLEYIHDEIGNHMVKNDGVINGKVGFSKTLYSIFITANQLRDVTESQYITSDHVLLAALKAEKPERLIRLLAEFEIYFDTMLEMSRKTHDVISNDVPVIDEDDIYDEDSGTHVRIIGGSLEDVLGALESIGIGAGSKSSGKQSANKKSKVGRGIEYCTNITDETNIGNLEPLIGREKELNTIYNILGRKKCNNALLIGESGVGKSQCVIGLAKNIVEGNVPLQFRNKEIWKLNPSTLVAGTQYRGMFEERLLSLVNQLKSNKNAILFIDDIETVFGKSGVASDYDSGGLLNELLSDGTVQIIATTTYKEYKGMVDTNPEIATKFQQVVISKPTIDECIEIVCGNKESYEKYHNVKYSEEIVYHTVQLCNRYITEKQLPASAFDIIDEIGSYRKINSLENYEAQEITSQIKTLEKVKDKHIKKDDLESAEDVSVKIEEFRNRLGKIQSNINKHSAYKITLDDLYHVISEHTNIPISKITTSEKDELKKISDTLKNVVVGQDEAIDIISRAIKRNKVGLSDTTKCRLSLMAIGPTGCGKTLIAKTLAKEIFGDEKYLVRFDMSEYSDETSVNKLIGSSAGYVGYTEGGLLTEAIKKNKYCVLLIDEIEKAHDKVYNLFLQILDEGFLTDNTGYKVDFRNTIIIMTSNVGAKRAANSRGIGFTTDDMQVKEDVLKKELKNQFPPEFLNRFDDIVYFNALSDDNLKDIIRLELSYLNKRMNKIGYSLGYEDNMIVDLLFKEIEEEKEYGARPIHRVIRNKIENKITDLLIDNDYPMDYQFKVVVDDKGDLGVS